MKAVLINVERQDILEIDLQEGLQNIYKAIGNNCDNIEAPIVFDSKTHFGNALYCDGEIRFREDDIKGGFTLENWAYPILNNALIVGTNEHGEDIDHDCDIEDLKAQVVWYK